MPTSTQFDGKRVVVTAAAAGLGRVIGERFAEAGARVFGCDIAMPGGGHAPKGIALRIADASDPQAVDRFFDEALGALGGLDVLVNNVGIAGPVGPVESIDIDGWRETMAVNVGAHFLFARRAAPVMKGQAGGCIVNISSVAGQKGYPVRSPYVASKWAVIGLTKALAVELGAHGVRVNAVCPGALTGERMDRVIRAEAKALGRPEDAIRDAYTRSNALRTWIDPNDIADTVLFLCSDAGKRITGEAIAVDGHTLNIEV